MEVTLTVFTPTYNRAYVLGRCYESLKKQTCKDFKWLIIDDGSTDGTEELVKKWIDENTISIDYKYQQNQGMHGAHNTAYELIDTEINVCIDSDDYMPNDAIEKIITSYTKEAGARDLYRQIDAVIRKVIIAKEKSAKVIVDTGDIEAYLGPYKYNNSMNDENNKTGIVNGLAYTPYGGTILKVTCTLYPGKGNITLTGALGDVIKESIYIALSYIKANSVMFKIDYKIFEEVDFHFHLEEGGIPKDGPSAGITIVTSILSLLKNKIISNKVSMTGEITLRGKVLPVGGLKEKLISAVTNGIDTVYLPLESSKELSSLPSEVKDRLNIILVEDYEDIYKSLFK